MSDLTATIRVESPTLALTEAVDYDPTATVRPVAGAGTVPDSDRYLFTVRSADFDRFEAGLRRPTASRGSGSTTAPRGRSASGSPPGLDWHGCTRTLPTTGWTSRSKR